MSLRQRCPVEQDIDLAALIAELRSKARRASEPFSPEILRFCAEFSSALFNDPAARALPELQALAFWLRPSEIARLKARFSALAEDGALLVPRGLVFHIAPGNVDTIFIYSWLFALLTGNSSVIRLPSEESPALQAILSALNALLRREEFIRVARSLWIISYGHEEDITSALSLEADVRVIWGGDETVSRLRALPISPRAKDLAFPNRYSLCAVNIEPYLGLDEKPRQTLAERFFNDSYWFEQQACSSPRLLIWCGARFEARRASALFFDTLNGVVTAKGLRLEAPAVLRKLSFAYASVIDHPVQEYRRYRNELTVLPLSQLEGLSRRHCGAGLFYEAFLPRLADLVPRICGQDQTLTHFGFSLVELEAFARALGGRGLNRLVPIGEALRFHRFWDGCDLLQEMTQRVYVSP